jgi:hypothetical protein
MLFRGGNTLVYTQIQVLQKTILKIIPWGKCDIDHIIIVFRKNVI